MQKANFRPELVNSFSQIFEIFKFGEEVSSPSTCYQVRTDLS